MIKFKNIIAITLVFIIALSFNKNIYSKEIRKINESNTYAKVLKVIDGDTIKVELSNKDTAYVKLKWVNAKGSDESFKYLTDTLLGESVNLVKDGSSYKGDKFNYMLVYLNGVNINKQIIENGYGVIDKTQDKDGSYNSFLSAEKKAKEDLSGMWRFEDENYSSITGESAQTVVTTSDRININTATRNQLEKLLKEVPNDVIREIIIYRDKNPFSNIQEIKFVKGFTKKMYDKNKHALTVSTNINKANRFELKTLNDLSDKEVDKIIDKRTKKEFSHKNQISDVVSSSTYSKIVDYIDVKDLDTINKSISYSKANISLSDKYYLTNAGTSYSFADDIINHRKNGYTYKTLMELLKLNSSNVSEQDIHYLQDNLDIFTDINTENIDELTPVFTREQAQKIKNRVFYQKYEIRDIIDEKTYNKVKDAIIIRKNIDEYVNINTATKEQMQENGLSSNDAYYFIQKRPMRNATQLPFDVANINSKISLYTNINTASKRELKSLNNGISDDLIDKIIKYRESDNFGSLQEVEEFFKSNNVSSVYDKIKTYIVVR